MSAIEYDQLVNSNESVHVGGDILNLIYNGFVPVVTLY